VSMLAELCLEPECRRGHGGLYDALNCGEVRVARLRRALSSLPLPAWDDGRIRLACDVSNWLRPDAETSPDRLFCHCYARGKGNAQMIPGWPYSWVAALEPGRTSWTLPLDAVRLGPQDDPTEVTAAQARAQARPLRPGDLAGSRRRHAHGNVPLRHRGGDGLGPDAPAAGAPRRLGGPRGRAARHRGDPYPASGRPPARAADRGSGLAVVLPRRRRGRRGKPGLAGVPATVRYRTHVPVPQTAARLDPAEAPRPRRRRPLDLARHR